MNSVCESVLVQGAKSICASPTSPVPNALHALGGSGHSVEKESEFIVVLSGPSDVLKASLGSDKVV